MAQKPRRWKPTYYYCALPLAYMDNWMPILLPQTTAVVAVIARATWGYHKETDVLANAEIARRAHMPIRSVKKSLHELREHGLLRCEGPDRHPKALTLILSRFLQNRAILVGH